MLVQKIKIGGIPALIWGEPSEKVYLHVHGKMSCKESAESFAAIAAERGFQTVSFDLPQHGERKDEPARCDIWNGIHDLTAVGDYVFAHWKEVSLYGCSLGAFFSLHAYQERTFRRCLFQSPILDMPWLIGQMMVWFNVSEERLRQEREVETPIDTLSWDYRQYALAHPVTRWDSPTRILYGDQDNLQPLSAMEQFAKTFCAQLTIAKNCTHPFMEDPERAVVDRWLRENI